MLFLHHAKDMVVRDQARMIMYSTSLKDRCSRRDVGDDVNATVA
jgi:hypothetical protein